jgi:hypothetical protein
MKGVFFLVALAALLVGCELSHPERIVSSQKTFWQGREGDSRNDYADNGNEIPRRCCRRWIQVWPS